LQVFVYAEKTREDNLNIERSPLKANVGTTMSLVTGNCRLRINKKAGVCATSLWML
jgi:hypothetical protein